VGPLVPQIQEDLEVSHAVAGLLGTIPVLCMGVFAPPAPHLARWYGTRAAVAGCLAAVGLFGLARALAPGAALVIVLTFGVGVGMGLAQTLMPVAVKERFPHRPAFATGIYATGINTGSALSSALAVPLADALGGWRAALLAFSLAACLLAALWLSFTRGEPAHVRPEARPVRLPWRDGLAWHLVLVFGVMSSVFYGLNAWLPDAYVERGWSEGRAGGLIGVLNVAALSTTLLVPWLADRRGSRRLYLTVLGGLFCGGTLGLAAAPAAAWAWAALAGVAVGGLFPLVMTLPLDVADRPGDVGAVAAMMLGIGYTVSAVAPVALGAARDLSGSFSATLWAMAAGAALLLLLNAALSGERLRAGAVPERPRL
jgi:CP family cyanate transporter-like MFS transporter